MFCAVPFARIRTVGNRRNDSNLSTAQLGTPFAWFLRPRAGPRSPGHSGMPPAAPRATWPTLKQPFEVAWNRRYAGFLAASTPSWTVTDMGSPPNGTSSTALPVYVVVTLFCVVVSLTCSV